MKKILSVVIVIFYCLPTVNAQTIKGSFINKRQQGKTYFFIEQKVIISIKLIVLKLI